MEETRRRDMSGFRHTYMEPSALTVICAIETAARPSH